MLLPLLFAAVLSSAQEEDFFADETPTVTNEVQPADPVDDFDSIVETQEQTPSAETSEALDEVVNEDAIDPTVGFDAGDFVESSEPDLQPSKPVEAQSENLAQPTEPAVQAAEPVTEATTETTSETTTESSEEMTEQPMVEVEDAPTEPPAEEVATEVEESPSVPEIQYESLEDDNYNPANNYASEVQMSDDERQRYFHEAYKQNYSAPTDPETWQSVLTGREEEPYLIQRGDTLWSISETFFGDGFFWPKVWSLNQNITNPHEIEPQGVVVFFPGSLESEPFFAVQEVKMTEDGYEDGSAAIPEKVRNSIAMPIPKKKFQPLINLPTTLPPISSFMVGGKQWFADSVAINDRRYSNNTIEVSSVLSDRPVQGIGEIVGVEMGGETAATGQYITVLFQSEPTQKKYSVLKDVAEIDLEPRKGYIQEFVGEIEVLDRISDDQLLYNAIVTSNLSLLGKDASLVEQNLQVLDRSSDEPNSQNAARIIGGPLHQKRKLFGSGSVMFVDGGSNVGLQVGQVTSITYNPVPRGVPLHSRKLTRTIGKAQVIDVNSEFATLMVLQATEPIWVSDYIGTQIMINDEISQQLQKEAVAQANESDFADEELNFEEPAVDPAGDAMEIDDFSDEL